MPQGQYSVKPAQLSVDYLLKRPAALQQRFTKDIAKMGFLAEAILQGGYNVQGGALVYNRTDPILPDEETQGAGASAVNRRSYEIVAEGARFPIIGPLEPTEQTARSAKHGLRMFITEEMRRRNQLPQVERRLRELKNELVIYVDSVFMKAFTTDTGIVANGIAVSDGAWTAANAYTTAAADNPPRLKNNILRDIEAAKYKMTSLRKGINPDTLLVNDATKLELVTHPRIFDLLDKGESSQPFFTGQVPNKLAGLDVLYSPFVPKNTAYVMQKKAFGGYGDEVPTSLLGPEYESERELYWFKGKRVMLTFIDAPEAVVPITGVNP